MKKSGHMDLLPPPPRLNSKGGHYFMNLPQFLDTIYSRLSAIFLQTCYYAFHSNEGIVNHLDKLLCGLAKYVKKMTFLVLN